MQPLMENEPASTYRRSTYRRIVSSTAIFGGAQVLTLLVNMVRGKLVATILHSAGMGMTSVISNAANTLQQFALMGLNVAAVPSIAQANADEEQRVLAFTIRVVRRLVLLASCFGLLITLALSPLMAELSFGQSSYTRFFLLLSLSVFFNVMATGELAVMQGMRRYKLLAFCSIVPACGGLLLSIPIYYIWGIEGIVPAMIVVNLVYFIVIRLLAWRDRRSRAERERITLSTMWKHGSSIIKFGMVMTVSTLIGAVATYALTAFISRQGSLSHVGFYQAAGTITTQYIGLIFTAMAADFYPHLSELLKTDVKGAHRFVNQQTEIIVLIVVPLVMLLILTAPLAIHILLTSEFLTIERMVRFLGLAGIFKALCFPMDYIAYAKGDTKYIFWVETVWSNAKTFTVMATSYWLMGLDGLGYGALCSAVIDFLVCLVLIPWRYGFHLSKDSVRLIAVATVMAIASLVCSFIAQPLWRYTLMGLLTAAALVFCIAQLDHRMDLRAVVGRIRSKWTRQAPQ